MTVPPDRPRIGAVTIAPAIHDPASYPFDVLYKRIGHNTGNYLFTHAIYRNIAGQVVPIGFSFDPHKVNAEFEHVVIAAANWLNPAADWEFLLPRLELLKIPVTTIGIGLQATTTRLGEVQVSPSARRLAAVLADKATVLSTRGNFTAEWLHSIGIRNVVPTGCPSLYLDVVSPSRPAPDGGVVLQGTRYGMTRAFLQHDSLYRRLYRLAAELGLDVIYQSEVEEIGYLVYGVDFHGLARPGGRLLPKLYGLDSLQEVLHFLDIHGRVFFSVDAWASYVQSASLVAGTRLHGAIVALNAGTPALLFPHDSRTQEVLEFAAIPTVPFAVFTTALRTGRLDELPLASLVDDYRNRRRVNRETYIQFLRVNGLAFKE